MKLAALATDYDGTIARHGIVSDSTRAALERFKAAGFKLLLVSGRELADLRRVFPFVSLFDRLVLENGGVVYDPRTGEEEALAPPPPRELIEALKARGVTPLSAGRVVVATFEPWRPAVLEALNEVKSPYQVSLNKDAIMLLPRSIDKMTGLRVVLERLGISPLDVAGVGDAENDYPFLRMCGFSAAVANALPGLKTQVHLVLNRSHGDGVADFIEHLLGGAAPGGAKA